MKRLFATLTLVLLALLLTACGSGQQAPNDFRAVYMLLDTSGTYSQELKKADAIINYLLSDLHSGEALAIARIDSGSFSEKDIIVKATFDERPSMANQQKRAFRATLDTFYKGLKSSSHTDIRGGMLQAAEHLTETGAGRKFILIFSDLEEDLVAGHVRDFVIPLDGITVVALNVTKLRSDIVDPREYLDRLTFWEDQVVKGGGKWRVQNDLERFERLLEEPA